MPSCDARLAGRPHNLRRRCADSFRGSLVPPSIATHAKESATEQCPGKRNGKSDAAGEDQFEGPKIVCAWIREHFDEHADEDRARHRYADDNGGAPERRVPDDAGERGSRKGKQQGWGEDRVRQAKIRIGNAPVGNSHREERECRRNRELGVAGFSHGRLSRGRVSAPKRRRRRERCAQRCARRQALHGFSPDRVGGVPLRLAWRPDSRTVLHLTKGSLRAPLPVCFGSRHSNPSANTCGGRSKATPSSDGCSAPSRGVRVPSR